MARGGDEALLYRAHPVPGGASFYVLDDIRLARAARVRMRDILNGATDAFCSEIV